MQYLHSYGIVHRDLKLDNIMMSDCSDQSIPKIVDFGLAKMIGPNEQADEPFGTLGYVAPEILRKQPYSSSCDLYSFGCLLYASLIGALPFDHNSDREQCRMTLEDPVCFDHPRWINKTPEIRDLLTKLLEKDPSKRITVKDATSHSWFSNSNVVKKKFFNHRRVVSHSS